jgi:arylsulfatase A-like enzyme
MPEYFAQHGYATFGCGKLYHNCTSTETFQVYGPRGGFGPLPRQKINYKTGHRLWDWGEFPESDDQMPDAQVADWAVAQLEHNHEKPFFLAAGFFRPHVPLYSPQKWWDLYPPEDEIELPRVLATDRDDIPRHGQDLTAGFPAPRHAWFVENGQWKRAVRGYLACVSFVDHQVGRVLAALDESPYADNTIVVLWGDHGWALGEKQRWAKRALWQRETGVPLIVAAPGMAAGAKTSNPAGLIDIYPTLVDLCGLPPNGELEGHSLVPQLKSPLTRRETPTICTFWKDNHAVISGEWRYIRYADGSEELYEIVKDPREWQNLAGDERYAEVIAAHAAHLPQVNAEPHPGSRGFGSAFPGAPP